MKPGSRVLGIDDAAFSFSDDTTFLTGVVYRGTDFIEDIETTEVTVDGDDSTEKVINLFKNCNNPGQIKAVLTDGISFAGFNVVDIKLVSNEIDRPVIAVTPNRPDREKFLEAMSNTGDEADLEELGEVEELELEDGTLYFQRAGCTTDEAEEIIEASIIHGLTPEPVRVAHIIGRAFQ